MSENYMAVDAEENVLKEASTKGEIFQWAWFSEYERGDIDIITVPANSGYMYL